MVEGSMPEGLQRIVDRIIGDARVEATRILDEARKRAELVVEERKELARKDAGKDVDRVVKEADEATAKINKQIVSSAKVEAARLVAVEKHRLIENVLQEAGRRLKGLKTAKEDYLSILSQMISKTVTALGGGELEILLCDEDYELASQLDLEAIARKSGVENKTRLSLAGKGIATTGGVVGRRVDGRASADYTFESLLRLHERALRLKVARVLFKP